jgi:drug/metabolite transporter (DMT)-like permease
LTHPHAHPLPRLGWLLLAAIALFWGTNWVAIKISLVDIPIWQYRAITCFVAGGGFMIASLVGGHRLAVPRACWRPLLFGALLNVTGWQVFSAYGAHMVASGKAAVLAYTMPIWTTLFAVIFLRERLTMRIWGALILSLAGVGVLLSSSIEALGEAPLGALLTLCAAASWGAGTVVLKSTRWPIPVIVMAAWQLLLGGVPIFIVAVLTESLAVQKAGAPALLALAYSLALPMLFCQYAWFKVVSIFPATIASIGTVMVPVVGIVSGAVILGEPLGWREIASLLCVVAAIALVLKPGAPKPTPKPEARTAA